MSGLTREDGFKLLAEVDRLRLVLDTANGCLATAQARYEKSESELAHSRGYAAGLEQSVDKLKAALAATTAAPSRGRD